MNKVSTIADGLENLGPLRTGGQGSVYKGRRRGEIFSAVKLLPTPVCSENQDDKNFKHFQSEVIKLKKVNEQPNPNVVKILSSGLTDSSGFPYIEMEYIEGPDLEELIKPPHDAVFSVKEVIKVAEQLAGALAHCHKAGVKHGDIKSNNVKFDIRSGNYVLLDFGLAVMSDEQRRTSLRYAGAIEFMAPEQSEGEMLFESDIYSFGIVIYELLAGTVPFPLERNSETARNTVMISHLESPVPDVVSLRRQHLPAEWAEEKRKNEMLVPLWLLEVVNKCLEKKPENRYKNGIALLETITRNITLPEIEHPQATAGLLQQENSRLHSLLVSYRQDLSDRELQISSVKQQLSALDAEIANAGAAGVVYTSGNGIHLSRAAFFLLLISILFVAGVSGRAIFSKSGDSENLSLASADTSVVSEERPAPTFYKVNLPESPRPAEAEAAAEKSVPGQVTTKKHVETAVNHPEVAESKKSLRKKLRQERQEKRSKEKKGKFFEIKIY